MYGGSSAAESDRLKPLALCARFCGATAGP